MEKKLSKIKMVFGDVDNTLLCLKMRNYDGKRTIGFAEYNDWLKYNIMTNAYIDCSAPKGMSNLINALHENGAKIYGLTECSNSFEYNSKYNRLRECYPNVFEHHGDLISIDDRHKKVLIMQLVAEKENLAPSEIMFIDDSYTEVMEAFGKGFFAMHTTEVMERFNDGVRIAEMDIQNNGQIYPSVKNLDDSTSLTRW